MKKRTQGEIDRQIEGIKSMKKWLPEYSHFGDANWEKMDAQLDILESKKVISDFEDEENEDDETQEIFNAALEAEDWLDGRVNEDLFEIQPM